MFSFIIFNILLFQCSKLYPLEDGTPSSYLLYIFNGEHCDAPNPKSGFFFFFLGYWTSLSRQRIYVATEFLCRSDVLVMCAPRPCVRA